MSTGLSSVEGNGEAMARVLDADTGYLTQNELFDSLRGQSKYLRELVLISGMSDQVLEALSTGDFSGEFIPPVIDAPYTLDSMNKVPVSSAAMDTVSDARVLRIMAEEGGRGTLPASLTPEDQLSELMRVKKRLQGFVTDAISLRPEDQLSTAYEITAEKGFDTFPVLDGDDRLLGIVSGHELKFSEGPEQAALEAMKPVSELEVTDQMVGIDEAYRRMHAGRFGMLPVLDDRGRFVGMYTYKDAKRTVKEGSGFRNLDEDGRYVCDIAVPTDESAFERLEMCETWLENGGGVVVFDTANGGGYFAYKIARDVVKKYPDIRFMSGNTINPQIAVAWAGIIGVHGIKVGQASGRVCKTKEVTGVGRGQATAVHFVVRALRNAGFGHIPVCSDGGVEKYGDVARALGLGATSVMVGTEIGKTPQAPGKKVEDEHGNLTTEVRGMGSEEAWLESDVFISRYDGDPTKRPIAEGESVQMPVGPNLHILLKRFRQATQRAFVYVGGADLKSFQEKARFEVEKEKAA